MSRRGWVVSPCRDACPQYDRRQAWKHTIVAAAISTRCSTPPAKRSPATFHPTSDPDHIVPALDETWTVRVYNLTEYFLVDITSRQRCASSTPLTINLYHYGGMAIRGNQQWFEPQATEKARKLADNQAVPENFVYAQPARDYLTSEGKTLVDGNGTRARWVEMFGRIDGLPTGVSVMCHPENFQAPQPVRLHPTKPYFCFAPMVLGTFQIQPGADYVSRYRYYVHMGQADAAVSDRLWNDYAHPPTALVVSQTP